MRAQRMLAAVALGLCLGVTGPAKAGYVFTIRSMSPAPRQPSPEASTTPAHASEEVEDLLAEGDGERG